MVLAVFRLGFGERCHKIDGSKYKQQDLDQQDYIPQVTGMIHAGFVKPEHHRSEQVDDQEDSNHTDQQAADDGNCLRESIFFSQIKDDKPRPEKHSSTH